MQHFVKNTPNPVNIAFEVDAAVSIKALGRQVKGSAQKRLRVLFLGVEFLGQPEVDQVEVSLRI